MIEELLRLFERRDTAFEQATTNISKHIDFVYEAIVEFLNENPHNISWDSVDVNSSNMIVIIARIFEDGIDPTQQHESQIRLLTIGIPFEIVSAASKNAVIRFLTEMAKIRPAKSPTPAAKRTLSELISDADDGQDIDLLLAEGEDISPDLLDILREEASDLDEYFSESSTSTPTFLSPYKKRTLH